MGSILVVCMCWLVVLIKCSPLKVRKVRKIPNRIETIYKGFLMEFYLIIYLWTTLFVNRYDKAVDLAAVLVVIVQFKIIDYVI
jgi:hypothetical protein